MSRKLMTRKGLAEFTGVNPETIRFYEGRGLLPQPSRSPSGYRQYHSADAHRLAFIRRAQELGFTLGEIGELLSLKASPCQNSRRVKTLANAKIAEIAGKIRDLKRMKSALEKINEECDGRSPIRECPILNALSRSLS